MRRTQRAQLLRNCAGYAAADGLVAHELPPCRMHQKLRETQLALESTENQLGSMMGSAAHRALAARDEVNLQRAEAAAAHQRQRERRLRLLGVLRGLSLMVRLVQLGRTECSGGAACAEGLVECPAMGGSSQAVNHEFCRCRMLQ